VIRWMTWAIAAFLKPKALLVAENLCLRQQLIVLQRRRPRPRLLHADRQFWIQAELARLARCLPLRHGADVDMTVADNAIQSNERLTKATACSRVADWSQAAT
jgi:hypothetical protein